VQSKSLPATRRIIIAAGHSFKHERTLGIEPRPAFALSALSLHPLVTKLLGRSPVTNLLLHLRRRSSFPGQRSTVRRASPGQRGSGPALRSSAARNQHRRRCGLSCSGLGNLPANAVPTSLRRVRGLQSWVITELPVRITPYYPYGLYARQTSVKWLSSVRRDRQNFASVPCARWSRNCYRPGGVVVSLVCGSRH
jgi:hypothetical protein